VKRLQLKCEQTLVAFCLCKVLKGGQEVGGDNKSQDRWIVLFTRDPSVSDLFKLVPNAVSADDKGEKHPQLNRSDMALLSLLPCIY